ncbi:MAG: hypothetical protein ACYSU7_04890, partial [Planctomycetota bacterium]
MNVRQLTPILCACVVAAPAWGGTTYYVNGACGNDAWAGTSAFCTAPDGPRATIQAAIDGTVSGDVVMVADGIYTGPGNKNLDFEGRLITVRSAGGP